MSYLNNARLRATQLQDSQLAGDYTPTPTFGETVSTAYQETTQMELLSSQGRMRADFLGPQINGLKAMLETGQLTQQEFDTFQRKTRRGVKTDWEGMATFANETKGTDFDFSNETMHAQAAAASAERQQILDVADPVSGLAASFIGTAGAMLDPRHATIEAASFLIGVGEVRMGATALSSIAKMAFREGAVNVGLESVYQANVYDFKTRIGVEYNASDGAVNLLAAFVFGGAVGTARGGYNWAIGNVTVRDAVEANSIIIQEMTARADLSSTDRVILQELEAEQIVYTAWVEAASGPIRTGETQAVGGFREWLTAPDAGGDVLLRFGRWLNDPASKTARSVYAKTLGRIKDQYAPDGVIAQAVADQLGRLQRASDLTGRKEVLDIGGMNKTQLAEALGQAADSIIAPDELARAVRVFGPTESLDVTAPSAARTEFINNLKAELLGTASSRISRGEFKSLQNELQDLQYRVNQITDEAIPQEKKRNVSARKAKAEGAKAGRAAAREEVVMLEERIDAIQARLAASEEGSRAEADLTRLDQGIIPDEYVARFNQERGVTTPTMTELAAAEDFDAMQAYFRAVGLAEPERPAVKTYNEYFSRMDTNERAMEGEPLRGGPGTQETAARIKRAEPVKKDFEQIETVETDFPPETKVMTFDEEGNRVEMNMAEIVDDTNTNLAEQRKKLDDAVGCILG